MAIPTTRTALTVAGFSWIILHYHLSLKEP